MHSWGDENVDWRGLDDCAKFLETNFRRWARLNADGKEKWGTVRCYVTIGWYSFHEVFYPSYHFTQWGDTARRLDIWFSDLLLPILNKVACPYHRWFYRRMYKLSIRKWPHLRKEILGGADHYELLEGL